MILLRRKGTALLCACLLALSACASHPAAGQGVRETPASLLAAFKKADTNGDEQLSREELSAGLPRYAANFDEIDTDHNGLVNFSELLSYVQWRRLQTEDAEEQHRMHRGGR